MIRFRCWYCNKAYSVVDERIGERITCTCKHLLRVPRRHNGYCRVKSPTDWLVEALVYGLGGALLGLGLGFLMMGEAVAAGPKRGGIILAAMILTGFLAGTFGGERGINWIGRMIRDQEGT
jgi:hypothetical protein